VLPSVPGIFDLVGVHARRESGTGRDSTRRLIPRGMLAYIARTRNGRAPGYPGRVERYPRDLRETLLKAEARARQSLQADVKRIVIHRSGWTWRSPLPGPRSLPLAKGF